MSVVAAAVLTSAAVGLYSANAAKQSAKSQVSAANAANDENARQYDLTRADNAPRVAAGNVALGQLGELTKTGGELNRQFTVADFIKDPGYDFRMAEGAKAIERSAAARGGVLGGGTLKALTQYSQNFASNEYNNAFSRWNTQNNEQYGRLAGIAGIGQTASAADQQAGQVYAQQFGNNTMGAANATSAANIASTNALANGINTGANLWMASKFIK